jgi:hypothetical protein
MVVKCVTWVLSMHVGTVSTRSRCLSLVNRQKLLVQQLGEAVEENSSLGGDQQP